MNRIPVNPIDPSAFHSIGYGLYVLTTHDGVKHNGMITNSVMQLTSDPYCIAVSVNKANYSCDAIRSGLKMNINCLTESAPFSIFERFGFQSGREKDKFSDFSFSVSENGLALLREHVNAYFSLELTETVVLSTHYLFLCKVVSAAKLSDEKSMTYAYYHENVKPRPQKKKKGFVCKICGYVHESDTLPENFICPWCKHSASDFMPL